MQRLPQLDGLRAASILLVLACHMLALGPKWSRLNETAGAMGMAIFFALSGFLITSNLIGGQSVRTFLIRRFARIIPLAYLYLAIVLLVVSMHPEMLTANLLFIENYQQTSLTALNGHFWSLCVEMHFYLSIAICVMFLGPRSLWLVFPACALITLTRIWSDGGLINIKTHLRVDEILAGACVALLFHNTKHNVRTSLIWFAVACLGVFWSSSPFSGVFQYARPYCGGALLIAALYLPTQSALNRVLSSRPAKYIATISYALYVIHPLTIYGWMDQGTIIERYAIKRPISFLVTFVLAHLSTHHWENVWIAWGKRITRRTVSV